jgi:hypothetical protein
MMIRPLMILTRSALALALLLGSAAVSSAASYGNFYSPGATVQFLNVADLNGLFGAPTVSFESLDFSPNTFEADCAVSASCPPTPHTVSDTLTLQIAATAGNFIEKIRLSEAGDTSINSFLNAFAATSVTADVFVDILAIDGSAVNGVNANTQMVFTSGGTFDTNVQGNGTHTWTGNLLLELDAIIAAAALTGQATLVEISISNTLTAFAESGASARIEKKDFDGVGITVIPEPASALLMGLGLAGLAWVGRRSSV